MATSCLIHQQTGRMRSCCPLGLDGLIPSAPAPEQRDAGPGLPDVRPCVGHLTSPSLDVSAQTVPTSTQIRPRRRCFCPCCGWLGPCVVDKDSPCCAGWTLSSGSSGSPAGHRVFAVCTPTHCTVSLAWLGRDGLGLGQWSAVASLGWAVPRATGQV